MRVLIATDAWRPHICGVVTTLEALAASIRSLGSTVEFITPEEFNCVPLPTYPGLRCALPAPAAIASRIRQYRPDAIHIATEGPIGLMVRRHCLRNRLPFTTSFTTRFPEYIAARVPFPVAWGYAFLRRFHACAETTMVSTPSLALELVAKGFKRVKIWSRGVDTDLFRPDRAIGLDLPRPIFLNVGRIAPEKNLEAFLTLSLPGTKVVIGEGPQEQELRQRFPAVKFLGSMSGERLAEHVAAADVFVFPSRTDTFGIVQLEALACGVPVAAFPVAGPMDVIGRSPVGVLDEDLQRACMEALKLSREACREHALRFSWRPSAEQFLSHAVRISREPLQEACARSAAGQLGCQLAGTFSGTKPSIPHGA
jgi:glycosyltransferase involved in cell wall biosynthesis